MADTPFPTLLDMAPEAAPDAAAGTLAAANRAARVAKYGEAAVAAMEKAGGTFGGGAVPAASGMVAPSAFQRAMPTFAAGWGALKSGVAKVAPFILPAVETGRVVDSAMDPNQTAGETTLRAGMGAGRIAGSMLGARVPGPWPVKAVASAAGYMLPDIAERASRFFTGGGAVPAAAAAPAAAPAAPAAQPAAAPFSDSDRYEPLTPPGFGAVSTVAPADPGTVPGTGSFTNNRTGTTTVLDPARATPTAEDWAASAANAQGVAYRPGYGAAPVGSAGAAVGALMNQRREAATSAAAAAKYKVDVEAASKAPANAHSGAQASLIAANAAAAERARASGADEATVTAIRNGHVLPADAHVFLPTMDGSRIDVGDRRSGAVKRVVPSVAATEANITAALSGSMKGKTRAEVIQAHKDRGFDVSGLK